MVFQPKLSNSAREKICDNYAALRQKQAEGGVTMPITARTLETMIRLASAHAKARLASAVTTADVNAAFALMEYAFYHDVTITKARS